MSSPGSTLAPPAERPAGEAPRGSEVRRPSPLFAVVGPPNSGKTTLFNQLTGLRQKVANYPGVTVEKHLGQARISGDRTVELLDLPGVHGFAGRSLDARITRDALRGDIEGLRRPDGIVLVVDVTNLESQLMLVEPVLEMGLPTLLVLNMADELDRRRGRLDDGVLGTRLGVLTARTNARTGEGLDAVRQFMGRAARKPGSDAERPEAPCRTALPVVEGFQARQRTIQEALEAASFRSAGPSRLTEALDAVLLHRVWGPVVFLAMAVLVFQAIFTWATPFMDGVELAIASSGEWLAANMPPSWFRDLLIDGVWAGVGSVVVFLPQILILFLFLGILEDSGYMARAAVIADRMLYRVGLQGRAFLPLLSGYACAVPAILSSRTVENERDRLATMFVTPFMTCSARLPVYALLIAAFIPERPVLGPVLGTRAATLLGLYALGVVAAVGTAFLLKRTLLREGATGFHIELPPYRIPSVRTLALRLLDRCRIFMRRAGKIIFTVAVVLWALTRFPTVGGEPPPIEQSALGRMGQVVEPAVEPLGFDWRVGVGLISSLAAREVIVGTLGTIYGVEDTDETSIELQAALQRDLSFGAAVGLLVFFAFALQCMSTVAVMKRETAGWKWPTLQFAYMLGLAYCGALLANWLL